jgi:hypothetical protein
MIRFVITDTEGAIDRTGHAPTPQAVWLQRQQGERVVVCPDFGFIDSQRLRIDFNSMLIIPQDGAMYEALPGVGVSVVELIRETEHAEA